MLAISTEILADILELPKQSKPSTIISYITELARFSKSHKIDRQMVSNLKLEILNLRQVFQKSLGQSLKQQIERQSSKIAQIQEIVIKQRKITLADIQQKLSTCELRFRAREKVIEPLESAPYEQSPLSLMSEKTRKGRNKNEDDNTDDKANEQIF